MRSTFLPRDARGLLEAVPAPWWIAGGWALDLALGRATRHHEDLDVAILRRDEQTFFDALRGWEGRVGWGEGRLGDRWSPPAPADAPALWCRPREDAPWAFELLLSSAEGDEWVFRHDARTRMALARVGRWSADGIPFLAPELVLLHKARHQLPRDHADFERALPSLDASARAWLASALARLDAAHPWLARLK